MAKTTEKYALEIYPHTFDREQGTGFSDSQFIRIFVTRLEDNKPISTSYTWAANFCFRAWVTWTNGEFRCPSWEPIYDRVFSVDFRESETMYKTLSKAKRAYDKLPVRPETFSTYVLLMAKALGINDVVVYDGRGRDEYRVLRISAAQDRISQGIEALGEIVCPKRVA